MERNMGTVDRVLRLIAAVVLATLVLTGAVSGAVGIVLGIVAVLFIVTSASGMCVLYRLLGIRTCKVENRGA